MNVDHTCATCGYRMETGPDPNNLGAPRGMECRRNPPMVNVIMAPNGHIATMGSFPPTKGENWCGEYKMDSLHIDDVSR